MQDKILLWQLRLYKYRKCVCTHLLTFLVVNLPFILLRPKKNHCVVH